MALRCFRACAEECRCLNRWRTPGFGCNGGTGRVGGSTAQALSKLCPDLRLVIGGLNRSVGLASVASALAVLEGSTQPGAWFPEEPEGVAVEAREVLLECVS